MNRAILSLRWFGIRAGMAAQQLTLPFKRLPSTIAPSHRRVRRHHHRVPMRDGVSLFTDVYLPLRRGGADAPLPAMLIRMPYGVREAYAYMPALGRYWAERGFAAVLQDVRGKFGSEGDWQPFANEVDDGYDTIEWVARQPWCDGRVAMSGESYFGFTQWAAAASRHPALVSIAPGDMGVDQYALTYQGGALNLSTTALWSCDQAGQRYINWLKFDSRVLPVRDIARRGGLPAEQYERIVDNPERNAMWDAADRSGLIELAEVPVFIWSGWWDVLLEGTLAAWDVAERTRPDRRNDRYLVVGPTDHETTADFTGAVGRVRLHDRETSNDRVLAFTRSVLDGTLSGPRVRAHVTGADRWEGLDVWPPASGQAMTLHPQADGSLTDAAADVASTIGFDYDPLDPVAHWEGKDLWALTAGLEDRRAVQARDDVLVFTSAALDAAVDLVGVIEARVTASSTAPGHDLVLTLFDLAPDGTSQLVQEGIQRVTDAPIGHPVSTAVRVGAIGYRFAAGHRIGLEITGSSFDRWDRNPHPGRTTIVLGGPDGTRVMLPVVEAVEAG